MSEEKNAGGQILAISRKEKNFSLKIGNEWYSGWNDQFKEEMDKGDRAELTYIENQSGDRTYKNIVEGKLKIIKADQKKEISPAANESPYERKEGEKREDILRSVSLKSACECMKNLFEGEANDEAVAERVLKVANKYFAWLKGEKSIKVLTEE